MSGQIVFTNNLTYAAGAGDVLNGLLVRLFDEDKSSLENNSIVYNQMGFKTVRVTTPDGVYSSVIGAIELPEITEGQDFPIIDTGKGADKGYAIQTYGGQIGITKLFRKWLEQGSTLDNADSSVKSEWQTFARNVRALRRGQQKTKNQVATQVFTEGWSSASANGPGSPTAYGQPLFSNAHPYGFGANAGTFQNILGGSYGTANDALDATSLQQALNVHKAAIRLQNGDHVESPGQYVLMVSRPNATTARGILNTAGNQVGMYSGTGNNANQLNTFSFNGNLVTLMENPFLGSVKSDGTAIGTDAYWFVINAEYAALANALLNIELWDAEVNVYDNYSNNTTYVTIDMGWTFDHFGAESYTVGSQGSA